MRRLSSITRYIVVWIVCLIAISATAQTQTVTVKRGETFELIAKRYGMTVDELKKKNPGATDGVVGMKLKVKTNTAPITASTSSPTRKTSPATAKKSSADKKESKTAPSEYESFDRIIRQVELSEKAIGYMQEQKYSKAIKVYDQLFKEFPNGEWFMRKGFVLYLDGKYKSAIGQYEKALSRNDMDDELTARCKEYLAKAKQLQAEKVARRKQAWANIGAALAVGAAVAGTAYAASQSSSQQSYTSSNYTPSTYTSSTYTSSNATSQFNSRSDQILANANRTANQIGQATLAQSQQLAQRVQQVSREQMNWAADFKSKNGREPTEWEMDNWLKTNYPDMWQLKIQSQANAASSSSSSSNNGNSESNKPSSTQESFKEKNKQYWRDKANEDCSMCHGTGKCHNCVDGYTRIKIGSPLTRCVSCKTTPGICEYCHGSKKKGVSVKY